MALTPYGYKIVNGHIVIDDKQAKSVVTVFETYISGYSLNETARLAGINKSHSVIGSILRNKKYLGTELYPPIIGEKLFKAVEKERMKRSTSLGRGYVPPDQEDKKRVQYKYTLGEVEKKYNNAFMQAEYAYSQIERDEANE